MGKIEKLFEAKEILEKLFENLGKLCELELTETDVDTIKAEKALINAQQKIDDELKQRGLL